MKKRQLAALTAALAVTIASVSGCAGSSKTSQTTAESATTAAEATTAGSTVSPDAKATDQTLASGISVGKTDAEVKKGGTLVVAMPSSPRTLDPKDYSTMYENHIMYNVAEPLYIWDQDYKSLIPNLATDCTVSEDGLSYTINLRDDVYFQPGKFQDGRKMTAEDVKYSLERSKNESSSDRICRDFFDYVEVVNDTQVILHMKEAAGPFMNMLADIGNCILPKEEVEGWGDEFGSHLLGTGPFILDEIVTDEKVTLKKNENYWGTEPNVDGIEFRIVSDSNQAINAVQTGEIDIAMYLQGESIKRAKDTGLLLQTPSSSITFVRFNLQNGPTANADVRKALTMAVDIDSLVTGIYQYGEGTRAYQPITAYSFAYDTAYNDLVPAYDVEGAKKLLAEAGYPDGFTMTLYIGSTTYREKMAQMLQYYWSQIGVTLDIKSSTMADWSAAVVDSWQSDVVSSYGVSWNSNPDPYGFLEKFFSTNTVHASSNAGGYTDDEVDAWLHEGFSQTDESARKEAYGKVIEKVMNDYTGIYYAYECRNWAVSEKVHDAVLRADTQMLVATPFNNIWIEE